MSQGSPLLQGNRRSTVFKDAITITNSDRGWADIADRDNESYLDPERLNTFFPAWVKERLEKLAGNAGKYAEFIKDCPK